MVEGKAGEGDFGGGEWGDEVVEGDEGGDGGRCVAQVRHHHCPRHRRQPRDDLRHPFQGLVALPAVAVAVRDEEEARLDLAEAVDHAADAEVG